MNCKICGAELKNKGEVCKNCMNKMMNEKRMKDDNKEIYVLKSKFKIGYELLMKIESIGIALFVIIILLSLGGEYTRYGLVAIPFFLIWGIVYLLFRKIKIESRKCVFYKTKFIYTYRKIRKKQVVISYDNVKEISYQDPTIGKMFNMGNIIITINSKNLLKRNIFIDAVEDVEKAFLELKKI